MAIKDIKHLPEFGGRNRYGRPFNELDPHRQIQVVLDAVGRHHLKKEKHVSIKSLLQRRHVSHIFLETCRGQGYAISNMLSLSQKHIKAALLAWEAAGISPATIQTRLSCMRWLAEALGKPGMVRDPGAYGLEPESVERTYIATSDKSWTAKGLDAREIIDAVQKKDPWVGIQFEMILAFGLRVQEAIMIKPFASIQGASLRLEEGTKGGRTRVVPILSSEQREVLERAKAFALRSPKSRLVQPTKSIRQAIARFHYVCRVVGITKKGFGVTAHGLRHQYANDRFKELSGGRDSAVRGGTVILDRVDWETRESLTHELGHARHSITGAYTGPKPIGRPPRASKVPPRDDGEVKEF